MPSRLAVLAHLREHEVDGVADLAQVHALEQRDGHRLDAGVEHEVEVAALLAVLVALVQLRADLAKRLDPRVDEQRGHERDLDVDPRVAVAIEQLGGEVGLLAGGPVRVEDP